MIRLIKILTIIFVLFPVLSQVEANTTPVKVAFVRDGYLWLKINDEEVKLTNEKATYPYPPSWSHDGKMILYLKEVMVTIGSNQETQYELWVYDFEEKEHRKIFYDAYNPKWSPTENIVAFQSGGVLNISDLTSFYNIALGISDYEWKPNGKGFIASSSATIHPTGWLNPILYTISIKDGYKNLTSLTNHVKELFVIPKEVTKDSVEVMSIYARDFNYAPNEKWISFIVSPTASMSMDSNMLCVISADGKEFETIDEIILHLDDPKWAYHKNLLGYIAGGGRIVFGFKNKDLKVTELPAYHSLTLTPPNYSEMGFTWVDDNSLIVSRVKESEWSNDPKKRPKPSLYNLDLSGQKQVEMTNPPKDKGDYQPKFLPSINKVSWIRKTETDIEGDL
ncbi:TolB domain-containing protein [Bacillus sp. FJAT-47783]|uniref:TolB family protein n=1 Tax=Bacillus sp. FJAT-47783 TaxID=2922712 RepID=UPI001FAC18C0|nr:TolB domain-containing protein [Bacillus sp. FJAT-47783]